MNGDSAATAHGACLSNPPTHAMQDCCRTPRGGLQVAQCILPLKAGCRVFDASTMLIHTVLQMVTANIIIQYMLTTDSLGSNALPLNVTTMDIADTKSRIQASRPACRRLCCA